MNKAIIIGNLTRDPELRTANTAGGQVSVCSFTVAVGRKGQKDEADFFKVTAWRGLAETCSKYLAKGRKVYVSGPVSVRTYQTSEGKAGASLEITAEDVEFLTPRQGDAAEPPVQKKPVQMTAVDDPGLPW